MVRSSTNIQIPVTNYIESVNNPYGLFRTLNVMGCCTDMRGDIELYCGNKSVVFPIIENGTKKRLKCYLKNALRNELTSQYLSNVNTPYLAKEAWLKDEIYVYDITGNSSYRDVSIAEWQEGMTLNTAIKRAALMEDKPRLEWLYGKFIELSLWLLKQEWAHGDIKPENIIVTQDGLTLIDLDAVYIPAFAGDNTDEIGTPGYQHPLRDRDYFNKSIDDYSIAMIATILGVLVLDTTIYDKDMGGDCCLFLPADIFANRSQKYNDIKHTFIDNGEFGLFQIAEALLSSTPDIDNIYNLVCNLQQKPIAEIDQEFVVFNKCSKWGYMSESGEVLIEPIFDTAHEFRDGLAAVNLGGAWQYIDVNGRQIINCNWATKIKHFSNNLAAVEVGGRWGYINKKGDMVIEPQYEMAGNMRKKTGAALVKSGGKYGYINQQGGWIIEPDLEYEAALSAFENKL